MLLLVVDTRERAGGEARAAPLENGDGVLAVEDVFSKLLLVDRVLAAAGEQRAHHDADDDGASWARPHPSKLSASRRGAPDTS